ncbi:MAG: cupin domain-containing protein [Phenylobacterium sp.]
MVRFHEAPSYEAPGHAGFSMFRLQGLEASPAVAMWVGQSVIAPGGTTTLAASAVEKIYVVIAGEVTIGNGVEEAVLQTLDSCRIAPDESRQVRNDGSGEARLLLAMQLPSAKS